MEPHKPHDQLKQEITTAGQQIKIGGNYAHYKSADKVYRPLYFATLEANDELCVVYQAQYGDKLYFVRPVAEWLETVEWQGKRLKRFTPET
jgi:hypothetical protein